MIPINSYKRAREHIDIDFYNKILKSSNCYFEFNKSHIWINKKIVNEWYKIDSLTGVNKSNYPSINNNGFLIIIENYNLFSTIKYNLNQLKKIILKMKFYFIHCI